MNELKDIFISLANTPTKERFLINILEEMILPWYQMKTGKVTSNKDVRRNICDRIETSLSKVVWVDGDIDDDDTDESPVYIISRVFPQTVSNGMYEVMVALTNDASSGELKTITLTDLLVLFKPVGILTFSDYDA